MLSETTDPVKINEIEKIATAISKSLTGVENDAAMMALCLVVADVISQSIDPEHWHLSIADVTSAIAANIAPHECEHCGGVVEQAKH